MYAAESVTGGPAVLNSVSCVAHLPQSPGTPAQSFHSAVFLGGHHDFGQYFQAVCGFFRTVSAGRNHQHVHHAFLLLPGTFQLIKKNRFMLNPGAWKEACVNFALFRLGLLSSKNCTCCSFQPSQLSNVAQANQYFCSGVRGFSGFPHTGPAWRSITSHTVHCPCCPPTKRGGVIIVYAGPFREY